MGCGNSSERALSYQTASASQPPIRGSVEEGSPKQLSIAKPGPAAVGVNVTFLRNFTTSLPSPLMSTLDVVNQIIIPRTEKLRCRLLDTLGSTECGPSTFFVSHCWKHSFADLVSRITAYCDLSGLDPHTTYLWLDIFAVNQHPGEEKQADLLNLSEAITQATRGTLLFIDEAGETLTRIWCLFEIHTTLMKRPQSTDLIALFPVPISSADSMKEVWLQFDVEKAKATIESDRVQLLAEFAASDLGFSQMNTNIKSAILRSSQAMLDAERRKQQDQAVSASDMNGRMHPLLFAFYTHARMLQIAGNIQSALKLIREAHEQFVTCKIPKSKVGILHKAAAFSYQGFGLKPLHWFVADVLEDLGAFAKLTSNSSSPKRSNPSKRVPQRSSAAANSSKPHSSKSANASRTVSQLIPLSEAANRDPARLKIDSNLYICLADILADYARDKPQTSDGAECAEEALLCSSIALQLSRQNSSENKHSVGLKLHKLACMLPSHGWFEETIYCLRSCIDIFQHSSADDYPFLASVHLSLGQIFINRRHMGQAESSLQEAVRLFGYDESGNELALLHVREGLAMVYASRYQYDEAVKLLKPVLAAHRKVFGDYHPQVATVAKQLAEVLLKIPQQEEEALQFFALSLDIYERIEGEVSLSIPTICAGVVNHFHSRRQFVEALPFAQRRVKVERYLSETRPDRAWEFRAAVNSLGSLLFKLGRLSSAEPLMRQSLELSATIEVTLFLAEDHKDLADLLLAQGRHEEANHHSKLATEMRSLHDKEMEMPLRWHG